jgi:hypothetical protein
MIKIGDCYGERKEVHRVLEDIRSYVRSIRETLEEQLRKDCLEEMSPEVAQGAMYGCGILEQTPNPEHQH